MINRKQIIRALYSLIVVTALMLAFEVIFGLDCVIKPIQDWVNNGSNVVLTYIAIWVIMFLQVTIVPIPAVIVLTASIGAGVLNTSFGLDMFLHFDTWLYLIVVMTAYMAGACCAYWLGRKFGSKAVKWIAGGDEDYQKWTNFLNKSKSKWIYGATVLLPIFPDDLLCVVCGAVKFDFKFFFFSNLIGRFIGLACAVGSLALVGVGSGSPVALIAWTVALSAEIIALIVLKCIDKNKSANI